MCKGDPTHTLRRWRGRERAGVGGMWLWALSAEVMEKWSWCSYLLWSIFSLTSRNQSNVEKLRWTNLEVHLLQGKRQTTLLGKQSCPSSGHFYVSGKLTGNRLGGVQSPPPHFEGPRNTKTWIKITNSNECVQDNQVRPSQSKLRMLGEKRKSCRFLIPDVTVLRSRDRV